MDVAALDYGALVRRAQAGQADDVRVLVKEHLLIPGHTAPVRTKLLIVLTLTELWVGDGRAAEVAADSCFLAANDIDAAGWRAVALGLRASARVAQDKTQDALHDLQEAEVILSRCEQDGVAAGAYKALANAYYEMGYFELSLPCTEAAVRMDGHPFPQTDGMVAAHFNLAVLHSGWADALERLGLEDPAQKQSYTEHLTLAIASLDRAAALEPTAESGWPTLLRMTRTNAACGLDPAGCIDELENIASEVRQHGERSDVAEVLGRLAQCQRRLGRLDEALVTALAAAEVVEHPSVPPSISLQVLFQLHEAQLALGIPGSHAVASFVRASSKAAWDQRSNSVAGFRAQLELSVLQDEHAATTQLAWEDPLTGAANRRALTRWLAEQEVGPAALVMVDIDDFKRVNDVYGHAIGDSVLCRLTDALRSAVRGDDLVARFGGDEFVVAIRGEDSGWGGLRSRVQSAVDTVVMGDLVENLTVRASIGMSYVGADESTQDLLRDADRDMFTNKKVRRVRA